MIYADITTKVPFYSHLKYNLRQTLFFFHASPDETENIFLKSFSNYKGTGKICFVYHLFSTLSFVSWQIMTYLYQRTSGPINAHLTPGLGIYFNAFIHVYSTRAGADYPFGDKILMTTERPFLFAHMLKVLKWSLQNQILYTFLMILYMYIAWGKGRKPLGDKLLMSTESPYPFDHLLQVSKKYLWILILYTFFNIFPHVYSLGAGADNPLWTKSCCQQKSLVTLPICYKFQKNIFEVWFYT